MRKGTWLRPMVRRQPLLAHYVPGHETDTPLEPDEYTRCEKRVDSLPAGAMLQDWRCPWDGEDTCQDCVQGLREDAEATP